MTDIERKQLPFALAGALNDVAFAIRIEEVDHAGHQAFDLRDPRFLRAAIVVDKARKADPVALVYDRLKSSDLALHASGKVKYPFDGHRVAVPTKHILPKRGARGVPKAWRPKRVMRKPRVFVKQWKGHEYIWRRRTKKRYPIEPLYLLVPHARMKARFPFYEAASKKFHSDFQAAFNRRFEAALRTARR